MMQPAGFLICALAFAALALAMPRPQENLFDRPLPPKTIRGLRLAGWSALLLALWLAIHTQGLSLGLVSYSGQTSLGAGLVVLALIIHDRYRTRGGKRPVMREDPADD